MLTTAGHLVFDLLKLELPLLSFILQLSKNSLIKTSLQPSLINILNHNYRSNYPRVKLQVYEHIVMCTLDQQHRKLQQYFSSKPMLTHMLGFSLIELNTKLI